MSDAAAGNANPHALDDLANGVMRGVVEAGDRGSKRSRVLAIGQGPRERPELARLQGQTTSMDNRTIDRAPSDIRDVELVR